MKHYVALFKIDAPKDKDDIAWKSVIYRSIKQTIHKLFETSQFKKIGSLSLINIIYDAKVSEYFKDTGNGWGFADIKKSLELLMDTQVESCKMQESWTKKEVLKETYDGRTFVIAILTKENCLKLEMAMLGAPEVNFGKIDHLSSVKIFDEDT